MAMNICGIMTVVTGAWLPLACASSSGNGSAHVDARPAAAIQSRHHPQEETGSAPRTEEEAHADTAGLKEAPPKHVLDRHGRAVPEEYACIIDLLRYLASRNVAIGGFDLKDTLPFETDRVMPYLSPKGVLFSEEEGALESEKMTVEQLEKLRKEDPKRYFATRKVQKGKLLPAEIERQLHAGKGLAFLRLVHLGNRYSIASPSHSELKFQPSGDQVVVKVGVEGYELTFQLRDGCYLEEIHYLIVEAH